MLSSLGEKALDKSSLSRMCACMRTELTLGNHPSSLKNILSLGIMLDAGYATRAAAELAASSGHAECVRSLYILRTPPYLFSCL
jgi:hypothetical protein